MKLATRPSVRPSLSFPPFRIETETRSDGTILLRNSLPAPAATTTLPERLAYWTAHAPLRVFLTEEQADGGRRALSFGAAQEKVTSLASQLLTLPLTSERPLLLVGSNSIEQALLILAMMTVGLPVAVVSPAYSARAASPWTKFQRVMETLTPGAVLADDPAAVQLALGGRSSWKGEVLPIRSDQSLADVMPCSRQVVEAAARRQDMDAPSKLLLTSGSTGSPKAVVNSQRMMVSNMLAVGEVWPFLQRTPPILVDWLPWNHTFGGNFCFNLVLWYGGTLHIDAGRPSPEMIGQTVEALRQHPPTAYFNVPAGFDALLPVLEQDRSFAERFFERLDFLFNAGAALPVSTRDRLDAVAAEVIGRPVPLLGAWGATETAPCSTIICFETDVSGNLGVPLPGTEIKLVPLGDRDELRVRGPNVMPGYWRAPTESEAAFDEEGFYAPGDAARLVVPDTPEAGLIFGGRIAENFKLLSGTWVNAGEVRLAAIAATKPYVADAVVAGEDRHELGVLLFLNEEACSGRCGSEVGKSIADRLSALNADRTGSSMRIARFAILDERPSAAHGEITDKGYLNQRAILERRAGVVEQLYGDDLSRVDAPR